MEVEFIAESISLDIPILNGVNVEEWNITPLVPPMVNAIILIINYAH